MPSLDDLVFGRECDAYLRFDGPVCKPVPKGEATNTDIAVRYRAWLFSREVESEDTGDGGSFAAATIKRFRRTVIRWDLTDAKGAVIPITDEGLAPLSTRMLNEIIAACELDQLPGKTTAVT